MNQQPAYMNYFTFDFNYSRSSILEVLADCDFTVVQSLNKVKLFYINRILKLKYNAVSIVYFQLAPGVIGTVHRDVNINSIKNANFALNIPLDNFDATFMHWFKQIDGTKEFLLPGIIDTVGSAPYLLSSNATKLESMVCNKPALVNIKDWHSVDNYGESVSKFISIRFAYDLHPELLAGDVGIEPTMSISKTDALTTWLIPNN